MDKKKGYICIFAATVLFSSMEIALKLSAGEFHPLQITMGRFLVGGLILIPFSVSALKKRKQHITGRDIGWFAILGFLGILVGMTCYQLSILYIEASKVATLFSSNPLFVTVFAVILLKEPLLKHKVLAIAGDILGIICIVQPWAPGLNITGVIFVMVSAILFALYGVLGKEESRKLGGVTLTCGCSLMGSAEMLLMAALTHLDPVSELLTDGGLGSFAEIPFIEGFNAGNIGSFLYAAVFATGMGYAAYFMAMEYVSAQEASMVFFFKPVLAAVAAAVILGEQIPVPMMAGIGFILAGSLISMLGDRKADAEKNGKESQGRAEPLSVRLREKLHKTEEAAEGVAEDNI